MSGRFRADGLSHACSASPLLRRRLAGTRATGKCQCAGFRLCLAARIQRRATEMAATSAPRKTRTPPARMNSCGARSRRHERHRKNQDTHQRKRSRANHCFHARRLCARSRSRSHTPKYEDRSQRNYASWTRGQTNPPRRSQQNQQRAKQQHNKFTEQPKQIVGSRHTRVLSARHYQTSRRWVQSRVP